MFMLDETERQKAPTHVFETPTVLWFDSAQQGRTKKRMKLMKKKTKSASLLRSALVA